MNDQWMIRGSEFTNCNCAFGCPCQFNSPSTNGYCEAICSALIEEGNFNDISLDGLCFVMLLKWPGEIAEGNGQQQLIIDESANPEQREALRKIAHGESTAPGATHYYVFNSTISKVHNTLYAPIKISIDVEARHAHTKIEGLVESAGTPLVDPFSGEESRARIHLPNGFEYTYAEMGAGTSKITADIELDLKNSYGQFNILHMNQDGVIR
ncbi:MAG: DUF1326 domain-containing protein [Candidatus Scalindua sediminis]|nr:DUF1326 domain-containing protein [Candidatus Scalindua sediminis]